MEKLDLNITHEGNELVVREGAARELKNPKNIELTGTITAPLIWYKGKFNNYEWEDSFVTVSLDKGRISLHIGDHEPFSSVDIHGQLQKDPDLQKFKINTEDRKTLKQMVSLIRMNRIHFADRDQNLLLVSNLQKFKARVTQEIESGNDFRGNKKQLFEQKVSADLELNFTLSIPLYKGFEKKSFVVEINFDITDGTTHFWLESVDLKDLLHEERKRIIDRELKGLKDLTIIYQ